MRRPAGAERARLMRGDPLEETMESQSRPTLAAVLQDSWSVLYPMLFFWLRSFPWHDSTTTDAGSVGRSVGEAAGDCV